MEISEFEAAQLRFFLSESNLSETLSEINPSLSWLPLLIRMDLVHAETDLTGWIKKNFADATAVQEVVKNLPIFRKSDSEILEYQLEFSEKIPKVYEDCWRLIIRHIRTNSEDTFNDRWFDVVNKVKNDAISFHLIGEIANILRPKLYVEQRFSIRADRNVRKPKQVSDLISLRYKIAEHISEDEALSFWPQDLPAVIDEKLLRKLIVALSHALDDAADNGVETNEGISISDSDVPSIAAHRQNANRSGFLPIVRLIAETWTLLAAKDERRALSCLLNLRKSQQKLIRRFTIFAATDPIVVPSEAARILIDCPLTELFLTNTTVEVLRLIEARWNKFRPEEKRTIEGRLVKGPPANKFRRNAKRSQDWARFQILGHMDRVGFKLGSRAQSALVKLRKDWPDWELPDREAIGFSMWSSDFRSPMGSVEKFEGVSDDELVSVAERLTRESSISSRADWKALCNEDRRRALRGLSSQASSGYWPVWAWHDFVWTTPKLNDVDDVAGVAKLFLTWPDSSFREISSDVSWWLREQYRIVDETLLWALWDRIADASAEWNQEDVAEDVLNEAISTSPGRIAEILINKFNISKKTGNPIEPTRSRLTKLLNSKGNFGILARAVIAVNVTTLFAKSPMWTKKAVLPVFDWSSPEAKFMWSARKYSRYIGPPKLFGATKAAFLETFRRNEVSIEEKRVYAGWLANIMLANQSGVSNYPLTPAEGRSALRRAGPNAMHSVAHRLAMEMNRATENEKRRMWKGVVGPVFDAIWPLDLDLQTSATTKKLVQLLRMSGNAFDLAASSVMPFLRQEAPKGYSSVSSLSNAGDEIYSSAPQKMLDLVSILVPANAERGVHGLERALQRIREFAPELEKTRKFQRLSSIAFRP